MRLLLLATYFPKPGNPLIGTWALDQAQAFQRAGATVEVISLTPWIPRWAPQPASWRAYSRCPAEHRWDGLTVRYPRWLLYPVTAVERWYAPNPAPWLALAWFFVGKKILRQAAAFAPDAIFAHHSCVNGWVAERVARALRVPFFCQDHALWEIDACHRFPRRKRMFISIAEAAAGMLAVSRRMADDIRALAPRATVAVLPNGANRPRTTPAGATTAPRPPVIFSAGMFVSYKGFDLLLRAWARVRAEFPTARLRIAGDGPERAALQALHAELQLGDSARFLGYLPQARVQEEMGGARAFILASWHETFGVVFLEAAAAGTPCIWARNAGVADVLQDGVHGLAVAPNDVDSAAAALRRLLAEPAPAAAMGAACARLIDERFSWEAIARQGVALFQAPRPSSA